MPVTEIEGDSLDTLADCYVLCGGRKRTPAFARAFLNYFVPNRTETCEEYDFWLPDQLGPIATAEFASADEAVAYMCAQPTSHYAIYWRNARESTLRFAMLFFLEDGAIVAGLSCNSSRDGSGLEEHYFRQLQDFCGSDVGYITYEAPPAVTIAEFLQLAKR